MDSIALFLGALLGGMTALAWALGWLVPQTRVRARQQLRDELLREAEGLARERLTGERQDFDDESQRRQQRVDELEDRARKREDALDRRVEALENRERESSQREATLAGREATLQTREAEVERTLERQLRELERIADLRREEAERLLLDRVERVCREEAEQVMAREEARLVDQLGRRSRELLLGAVQRTAVQHAHEAMVATVPLPSDELKGVLIGRDGRNIRAFETQTGVDLLVDDTPGVVVVSCFDPVRREVARRALTRLVDEGRVHPPRIEVVVAETRQDLESAVQELGRAAADEVGVALGDPLTTLLGRLEFCTAEGQNLRRHSIEVAHLAATLAGELELDPGIARRCALLHDIGHAVAHEAEGSHARVGAAQAERAGEDQVVVNAIAAHHGEVDPSSPYAVLVQVANQLSSDRPGARDGQFTVAARRQAKLEALAEKHTGVKRAYAIQAGRQVRVIVDPDKVNDRNAQRLAREIVRELEAAEPGPGEIKVTVVRELRQAEAAS